ncbi:hypothetical protein F5Y00DRAFT_245564 [Daldinia vernicosa]|uniref:uncharacterized protein n=1 Tax=Daldinia vernicosa TaxID=114800 RepID=UPI0020077D37|nr:uncharacterized protein F5Y00DRAFT_245564 [Daldinia vernicosa]KAI0845753.1 hypothetical protein F5Y00DRAFT_245564 [Daldinia vernicosa]
MATSTVAGSASAVYLLLCLTCIISIVSADVATTSPMQTLPDYYELYAMALTLTSASGPVQFNYKVAPLTAEAGLNQTNENALETFKVEGRMVIVDQSNYNKLDDSTKDAMAYISCDATTNDSYISPDDVLNSVMTKQPKAILLFSTSEGTCCSLDGSNLPFKSVWTMTDQSDAWEIKNQTVESTVIRGTITGANADGDSDIGQSQGGNNSAVAMSILYSITGLITLLFLIIIATGAIRAHRHPERYGPRASYGGRPRQSRAKGLARAVLETLPIVKFGDPQPVKPDPENEHESISGDHQLHSSSPTQRELTSYHAEQGGSSPDAVAKAVTNSTTETPGAGVSGDSGVSYGLTENEHLGCSICTEDFTVGQDVRVLPCDHKFHPQCIDPWLVNVSGTCPLCRLDLRPHEEEDEEGGEGAWAPAYPDIMSHGPVDSHLAPPPEDEADATQRRRRSRLLDWNRLRHATVDERIQALRQYRQTQGVTAGNGSAEDQNRHAKLSDRLREKFHIRTRAHPPSDLPSTSQ